MTRTNGVYIFVVGLLAYIQPAAPTRLETVWLKDVTTRFQIDKRTLTDFDLPNELTFHLRRGSDNLTLNMKRNHDINPNADVFVVRKVKDGQSVLVKTRNLEKEDVAYYQDKENGAFMTVRCVKRSNGQCDRVISLTGIHYAVGDPEFRVAPGHNGCIRIGNSSYDLRPAETDVTSRNLLEVPGLFGKRYVLQDQALIEREHSVENKAAAHSSEKKVEQELKVLLGRFEEQHRQNHFPHSYATLSSRNVGALHERDETEKSRQVREVYNVEVAVLIDSGIWNLYSSTVQESLNPRRRVQRKIREAYSHIMNGVNLRYKEIEDDSISINVILCEFIFFEREDLFPHKVSRITIVNDKKHIDAKKYLEDIAYWDMKTGVNHKPVFDLAMLFTSHNLHLDCDTTVRGLAYTGGVCMTAGRSSVVQAVDYVWTVWAAAHELGHSLGANHDGVLNGKHCKADDLFIMTPNHPGVDPARPYSSNPLIFSHCSVKSFKKTLRGKLCVTKRGYLYNDHEYNEYLTKQPGEVYTPNEQCHLIKGPKSVCCETVPADICLFMRCTDPKTGICMAEYFGSASGTKCGQNMWCMEGRCASKFENKVKQRL